jgi:hypothetical protein
MNNNSENNQTNNNLTALRADVAATTDVLKVTVDKLVQRGENLTTLNDRAEDLSSSSYHFRGTARRVNRHMRWQNYKLTIFNFIYLFFLVLVVICVIGFIVLMALHPWKK